MFKKKTLFSSLICGLALILLVIPCMISFYNTKNTSSPMIQTRTTSVELSQQTVDYQSVLNQFENGKLETVESLTTFEGYQTIRLTDLEEIDNLSETDIEQDASFAVKYNFSYDSETNVVTLSATSTNELGVIEVDEIQGLAFVNEKGELDAVLDIDGDYVLLSELQDAGLIQNCGWFKRLFKKVVVAVVAVVVVAAVAAAVVATAGAGLGACIAAGAVAGGIAGGVAGGVISYTEYGKLDWRWIAGGVVVGAAIGAVTGWGVGSWAMKTPVAQANRISRQTDDLIKTSEKGKLGFSESIKNKSYFQKGSHDYREYYEQTNLISQEIMKAKSPIVESGTNYLKWTVEGVKQSAKHTTYGTWELVVDPVKKVIVHFLFAS